MKIYQRPKYHEWRWRHLVSPLFEKDGRERILLDLGCNAGFYMQKAEKCGYKAFGVERDPDYISQAPKHLNIVEADVNYYRPRCAYLTLMCCLHYHQSEEQIEGLLRNLLYSTIYLLVMGRTRFRTTKTDPTQPYIMKKLRGWKVIGSRKAKGFYTVLVRNTRYKELNVEDLYRATNKYVDGREGFDNFVPAFEDFVRRTLDDFDFDPTHTDLMKYFKRRGFKYPLGHCWDYKVLIDDIRKNGLNSILRVQDGRMKDGYHRIIIMRELGLERVMCRILR